LREEPEHSQQSRAWVGARAHSRQWRAYA
jgi:hypothetical protein